MSRPLPADPRDNEAGIVLNAELKVASLADEFGRSGRIVIPDALEASAAERIYRCLKGQLPWRLAYRDTRVSGEHQQQQLTREQFRAMGAEGVAALRAQVLRQARDHFQYLYQHFNINGAWRAQDPPGLVLYEFLDYMLGGEFLGFARRLTGAAELDDVYAHATLYAPGHFLKTHEDVTPADDRRCAYVFGFTRDWRADMGGLLHFLDGSGRVAETRVPGFNTLTLFRVPTPHLVSMVSPWVDRPRLAVTGWLLVKG